MQARASATDREGLHATEAYMADREDLHRLMGICMYTG